MAAGDPPTPDAGPGEQRDEPDRQIVVNDPEDFAKTRQLRAIFDALDDYQEQKRAATKAKREGEISLGSKSRYIFEYMQDFAMAVEPLAKSDEKGLKLWRKKTYSYDGMVIDSASLPDIEAAKREILEPMIEKHVSGLPARSELQKATDIPGFSVPDEYLNHIEQHYKAHRERYLNATTQEVQRLLSADTDDLTRINPARVQSGVEQLASPEPTPAPPVSDIADAIIDAVEDQQGHGPTKEAEFNLRKMAADWGWRTEGVGSMLGTVPKLMYPDTSKNEFRPTAPPKAVADEVVQDLRGLIQHLGLGIDFNEEQQTKIDDDLLEEVDEWREGNT